MPSLQSSNKLFSSTSSRTNHLQTDERVRKRYFDELKALDCLSSEDDNYPEGPPPPLSKKQRRHLGSIQGSLSSDIRPIQSTLTHSIYNQLVVVDNKLDKSVDDEFTQKQTKIPGPSGDGSSGKLSVEINARRSVDTRRAVEEFKPVLDVLSRVSGSKNMYDVNEETYKVMLSKHRTAKREGKLVFDKEIKDTRLEDIAQRVRFCSLNKRPPAPKVVDSPRKIKVKILPKHYLCFSIF